MILFDKLFAFIPASGKIRLLFFLILIFAMRLVADPMESNDFGKSEYKNAIESGNASEITNPTSFRYLAFEILNCSQTITESHRLMSVTLSNHIVSFHSDFRRIINAPEKSNFNFQVPIYIKGHAFLI
jgi:hypothetical protein